MDTKLKRFSYSVTAKIIAFIITIVCFTGAITIFLNLIKSHPGDFGLAFEDSYYLGRDYISDSRDIVESLKRITENYKSEEHVLNGGTLTEDRVLQKKDQLFREFENNAKNYNPNLTTVENYRIFEEVYAGKIAQIRGDLIKEALNEYKSTLRKLEQYPGIFYYAKDGETEFSNSPSQTKEFFHSFPSYMILTGSEQEVFPREIKENTRYNWVTSFRPLDQQDVIYVAFTGEFLNPKIAEWQTNKALVTRSLYQIAGLLLGLAAAFIYLILVIGRKPQHDEEILLNSIDRIYNDVNIGICCVLIALWVSAMGSLNYLGPNELIFPITMLIATVGLVLVLSLVKHIKNKTFIKHSLTYEIFRIVFTFVKDIFNSGTVAVKVVLIIIVYPLIAAATFFMFPITIGAAVWFALQRVKEFNAIKDGVKRVKEGNIHHTINVSGDGEFAKLAADINSITDGLNKAVENEIKSERLKSELITNVSHDIRTPLTAIITYVDLLKNESDHAKEEEYLAIIDQKAQRLKVLTEDLFEAAKASSGNIPVSYERIDIASLITQGLGELDDKIQERKLEFKVNYPNEKVYLKADGKLLWRALENLLSNILKYALEGSRVYIDIVDLGAEAKLVLKNISAYELNVSADELMERFKRGDESRSSQGSGLGLSIAESLIEIQKGSFEVEIDGDLFKATIQMNKASQ